ncbi:DUF3098 domain-containing protein [Chitinophaga sedimenti]|uniref:DUF3098 domain-containing protein n=1 Tax=Chitinophaga sedimenti TaxID=2033606 RepID=UPI002005B820|nr:DUF3098 domain-containing protein [Chitinophaga sedimenti]MCK7559197.1 DUF3098 domain-containing protein [Chitinophaga sedimenti]
MAKEAAKTTTSESPRGLFSKDNYIYMLAGVVLIIIGFLLMMGGGNSDGSFDAKDVYSFRRITLAPIVILIGLGVEVYAIMRKPKA